MQIINAVAGGNEQHLSLAPVARCWGWAAVCLPPSWEGPLQSRAGPWEGRVGVYPERWRNSLCCREPQNWDQERQGVGMSELGGQRGQRAFLMPTLFILPLQNQGVAEDGIVQDFGRGWVYSPSVSLLSGTLRS